MQLHAERDVVVDRHRERRGLLEHHADPGAQRIQVDAGVDDVLAVHHHLAGGALSRIQVVHAVQHAQQRRFAAAGRADHAGHLPVRQIEADLLQRPVAAVEEIQVADGDARLIRSPHRSALARHRSSPAALCSLMVLLIPFSSCAQREPRDNVERQDAHRDQQRPDPGKLHPVVERRAGILVDRDRQAGHRLAEADRPVEVAEAGEQQGRGFSGDARDREQYAGDDAVLARRGSRSGRSPSISARPAPTAASRRDGGISRSMSSVVRTTIGMTITASARQPAMPEKPPNGSTTSS